MTKYTLDPMFVVDVCSLGTISLRHRDYMCGREISKYLVLSRESWLALLGMKRCIENDIETFADNKQYDVGSLRVLITSRRIALQYWIRREKEQFRPTITSIRLTFTQWRSLMEMLYCLAYVVAYNK